jgi:hypothetical protein
VLKIKDLDLWESFQYNVADFIKSRGGEAQIRNLYSARQCWEDVQRYRTARVSPPSGLNATVQR